ncbi:MAG: glycosyltransferase family 2 protein [Gemmatimonadaceae bacterium]
MTDRDAVKRARAALPMATEAGDRALSLGCHSCHVTRRNDVKRHIYAVANAVQERVANLPGVIRHVHGPLQVDCAEDELVVLSIGRDAAPWLDDFVEHHLSIGARQIFFLDNGSTDDTLARAARHDRVTAFTTTLSFKRYEVGLRRWITRTFGRNRWSLYCDADELFDYPLSDHLPLSGLLRYLRQHGYKAATGQMLDLFSDRPFSQIEARPGERLRDVYRYYDLTDLVPTDEVYWIRDGARTNSEIVCLFGGIRKRFFGDDCLLLTKHPLLYADDSVGIYTYDGHFHTNAPIADISTALLHFKYVASLPSRVRRTVEERWHNKAEALYGGLSGVLGEQPDLCLRLETARELHDVNELVQQGFLMVTEQYRRWVDSYGR